MTLDDGDTVPRPPAGAAPVPPLAPDTEETVLVPEADAGTRRRRSARPRVEPAALAPAALRLAVPGIPPLGLEVPVRLGRRPASPRIPGSVALVALASPGGQISATHLEVRASRRGAILVDLNSTNGSTVTTPSGRTRLLARGDTMVVPVGTRVDLGDGVVVELLPPPGDAAGSQRVAP